MRTGMSWLCSQVQDLFGGVPGELLDMYGGQPDVEIVGAQESLGDSGGGGGPGEVRRSSAFHAWNDPGPRTFIGRSRRPNVRRRSCSRTPDCSSWWSVDLSMTHVDAGPGDPVRVADDIAAAERRGDLVDRCHRRVGAGDGHRLAVGAGPRCPPPCRWCRNSAADPASSRSLRRGGRGDRGALRV